jgi:hypothetical protein
MAWRFSARPAEKGKLHEGMSSFRAPLVKSAKPWHKLWSVPPVGVP